MYRASYGPRSGFGGGGFGGGGAYGGAGYGQRGGYAGGGGGGGIFSGLAALGRFDLNVSSIVSWFCAALLVTLGALMLIKKGTVTLPASKKRGGKPKVVEASLAGTVALICAGVCVLCALFNARMARGTGRFAQGYQAVSGAGMLASIF
jgi:hypothetical protein